MFEIENLDVRYGQVRAVAGLSLHVDEGELVALVGPNGAGKSSTMTAIAGLHKPTGGSIRLRGEEIAGNEPESVVRKGIALVPETRNIFVSLTVRENMQLGITIRKDREQAMRDIDEQLDRFPILRERIDQPAGYLSGGEQQQLAIARALVTRPALLLLDEPSLGLAPQLVDLVFETVEQLRDEGLTTLLVEQNAARAVAISDRAYVMRHGSIAMSGTGEELEAAGLADEYLGTIDEPAEPGAAR